MGTIFVQDSEARLAADLRRAGLSPTPDPSRARVVLSLVDPAWLATDGALDEVRGARRVGAAWVAQLRVDDNGLADAARARLAEVQRDAWTFEGNAALDRLIDALRALGADPEHGPSPEAFALDTEAEPYLGAHPFDATDAHAAILFGRDREILEGLTRLRARRATRDRRPLLLVGAPRIGKSSFVSAGLVPRLGREGQAWLPVRVAPDKAPLRGLAAALAPRDPESLHARLTAAAAESEDALDRCLAAQADALRADAGRPDGTILLVVDPLRPARPARSDALVFDAVLRAATRRPDTWQQLWVTRTADLDATLDRFRDLDPEPYDLRPMPAFRFDAVVTGPARRCGLDVDADLVSEVVTDAHDGVPLAKIAAALGGSRASLSRYRAGRRLDRAVQPGPARRRLVGTLVALGLAATAVGASLPWLGDQWRRQMVYPEVRAERFAPYRLDPARASALAPGDVFQECARCPEMIVVPPGRFRMGDAQGEDALAQPAHEVELARSFAMGRTEVTIAEYLECVDAGACRAPPDLATVMQDKPLQSANWYTAVNYAEWLSEMTGQRYRLPSEAEWEYAARAGTETIFSWGDDPPYGHAHCLDLCGSPFADDVQFLASGEIIAVAPVGSFPPNPFGLFDVHGNVSEWVQDCGHPDYVGAPTDGRPWMAESGGDCTQGIIRGELGNGLAERIGSAYRTRVPRNATMVFVGFRVVRDL